MNTKWKSNRCPHGILEISGNLFLKAKCTNRCEQWRNEQCPCEKNIAVSEMTPYGNQQSTINCMSDALLEYSKGTGGFAGIKKKYELKTEEKADKIVYMTSFKNWKELLLTNRDYLLAVYCHCTCNNEDQRKVIFSQMLQSDWQDLLISDPDYYSDYVKFKNEATALTADQWFEVCLEQPSLIYNARANEKQEFSLRDKVRLIAANPSFDPEFYAQVIALIRKQPLKVRGELWSILMIGADQDNGTYSEINWSNSNLDELSGKNWSVILKKSNLTKKAIAEINAKHRSRTFTDEDWNHVKRWSGALEHPSILNFSSFFATAPQFASSAQAKTLYLFTPLFIFAALAVTLFFTENINIITSNSYSGGIVVLCYGLFLCIAGSKAFAQMKVKKNVEMFLNVALLTVTGVFVLPFLLLMLHGALKLPFMEPYMFAILLAVVTCVFIIPVRCVARKSKTAVYIFTLLVWLAAAYFLFFDGAYKMHTNAYLNLSRQAEALFLPGSSTHYFQKHLQKSQYQQRWKEACQSRDISTLQKMMDEEWLPSPELEKIYLECINDLAAAWSQTDVSNTRNEFSNIYKHFQEDKNARRILCEKFATADPGVAWLGDDDYYRIYRCGLEAEYISQDLRKKYLKNLLATMPEDCERNFVERYGNDGRDVFVERIKTNKKIKALLAEVKKYNSMYSDQEALIREHCVGVLKNMKQQNLFNENADINDDFITLCQQLKLQPKDQGDLRVHVEGILKKNYSPEKISIDTLEKLNNELVLTPQFKMWWIGVENKQFANYSLYDEHINKKPTDDKLFGNLTPHKLDIQNGYKKYYSEELEEEFRKALQALEAGKPKPLLEFHEKRSNAILGMSDGRFWLGYVFYLSNNLGAAADAKKKIWTHKDTIKLFYGPADKQRDPYKYITYDLVLAFAQELLKKEKLNEDDKESLKKILSFGLDLAKKQDEYVAIYKLLIDRIDFDYYLREAADDKKVTEKKFLWDYTEQFLSSMEDTDNLYDDLNLLLKIYQGKSDALLEKEDQRDKVHAFAIGNRHEAMLKKLACYYINHKDWKKALVILNKFKEFERTTIISEGCLYKIEEEEQLKKKLGEICYNLAIANEEKKPNIDELCERIKKGSALSPVLQGNFYLKAAYDRGNPDAIVITAYNYSCDYYGNKIDEPAEYNQLLNDAIEKLPEEHSWRDELKRGKIPEQ